jgi:3D (Asp-Asp-Asp) domain-containing protein
MKRRARYLRPGFLLALLVVCAACAATPPKRLLVSATAYNSLPEQTQGDPNEGAWGDVLVPGTRAIAVSRDLLELGLVRGTRVRIEGLPGEYRVLDKMAKRWKRKIDIYMGVDRKAALAWGIQEVSISWTPP